jgi:hypothetical protein
MDKSEKIIVKELGDKIGFGNVMTIACECWQEDMKSKNYPITGVFIPVLPIDIKKTALKEYNKWHVQLPR